jgi:phospholipase C
MDKFLEWIQNYLNDGFENDSEITKKVTVELAYKQGNKITTTNTPQIQIQIMDNAEVERYSSFEGENVSSIPLQITAYTSQMKINNVMKSAQESSIIFGQKIKTLLNKLRESVVNENISRCRIATTSPALPLLEGEKVYMTAIRCEFWIAQNNE